MVLDIQQILIGDKETYLDTFLVKKKKLINTTNEFNIFLLVHSMDHILNQFDSELNSIASITYINDNSFLKYDSLKQKNYELGNIVIPYGFGSYFHNTTNDKFRIISIDNASIDNNPIFLKNHTIHNLITPFSDSFNYVCGEGLCDFSKFDYFKYLKNSNPPEYYSVKLMALNGHVHLKDAEVLLNDDSEFYFENHLFIENPKQISEFIKLFRGYEKSYKINMQFNNNFDYSHLMLSHEDKLYYYTEATSLNENTRHDRLGFILELTPDEKGIKSSKISLVNYFECLNNLKFFQESVKNNKFNSDVFISNLSSKLGLFFK